MKNTTDEIDISEVAEESPNKIAHLKKANANLMSENKKLREALGDREEMVEQVCGAVTALEPFRKFEYARIKSKTTSAVVPVLKLSDWHIGEVVLADETEGFNQFNWDIAQAGVFGIIADFLKWVEIQRSFYPIKECAVFCEGDWVSGDIHDELKATNEFPLPVQTARAGALLGEVFRILSSHFSSVTAHQVGADNHGRLQKKPQAKQKASNNMSFLVHEIANAHASRSGNFKANTAVAMKMVAEVNSLRFLIEHGDTLKGWMGLPFYSFAREIGREATRRMNTDKGFDFLSVAHFHTPCFIEGRTLLNGSLSGTSEFDHACGRTSKPCQVAFLTHPLHGIFNFTPFVRRDVTKK